MASANHDPQDLAKTPLYDRHVALGARMVPFAGFAMPVQYSGLIEEHNAVRGAAGVFDVSHMGECELRGPQAADLVDRVTPSRLSALEEGRVAYSGLTTEKGTFVDDVLVYRLGAEHYLIVLNAANQAKDVAWIESHAGDLDVRVEDVSRETALIAFQGPSAKKLFAELADFDAMAVKYYRVVEGRVAGRPVRASRTGYTGELGWEVFTSPEDAGPVWDALLEVGRGAGIRPAGLGARDSLRLEAALPLYGNDIDDSTTVLEAGLDFIVDWDKPSFIGREALLAERESGPRRTRIGFEITGRGIARQGHPVLGSSGERIGTVTSGSFSPTLQKGIGMALVDAERVEPSVPLTIEVRGRPVEAQRVAMPFYRRPRKKKKKGSASTD
jgi:aminomethyltransferase